MIISYQWLSDYLQEPLPLAELSNILTSIGLEVEAVEASEAVKGSLEGLVIGQVLSCERHPNADKLSLTTVSIGQETPLKIVCGAPNVAAGQKVVVAPVGAKVHPTEGVAFEIKKAKIRGEESQGMICAEDEIGLGKSHAGIMILPEDAPVGTAARTYFNIADADYAIHIGLTPNRSDAMSHIGVARDVCAYLSHHRGTAYAVALPAVKTAERKHTAEMKVQIEALEACPRYTGISLSGVQVGPSPDWLQQRLRTVGVRPVNNVVDITNFVLHEFGQPLHAFDADRISGKQINVRFLPESSLFTTLDEKQRKLQGHDLMICDADEGLCIAGVFGGLQSGVTLTTTNIFLESAYFNAFHIRRTSMHHGLRTDAATHFEKGVDVNNLVPALMRAAAMIVEHAGGTISSEVIDVYPQHIEQAKVEVSYRYIRQLSGKDYDPAAIRQILQALGFIILHETTEGLSLQVPTNKTDVSQPADIVEEILRIDGLDNIEIPQRLGISLMPSKPGDRELRERVASLLCGEGFQEIVTNSIVNSRYFPERNDLVRMLNSLSSELDIMRPSMLESGLEVIQYNCNRKNNDLQLFEMGNTYTQQGERYVETAQLALWLTGNSERANWDRKSRVTDLFHLKGVLHTLFRRAGIRNLQMDFTEGQVIWKYKNQELCTALQVSPARLKEFDLKQDVFFAAINWTLFGRAAAAARVVYSEVPKFPVVERDLAIILDRQISYQQVQQATEQLKLEALKEFGLFDVFESEKLGANKKSYALNYTFQLQDRTLTDTEIDQLMQQLMNAYRSKLQAQIRE